MIVVCLMVVLLGADGLLWVRTQMSVGGRGGLVMVLGNVLVWIIC